MARIVYALSGQGRGHASRCLAISAALRKRGHEVLFCGGGIAKVILAERGESIVEVPELKTVLRDNIVQAAPTLIANWASIANLERIVAHLTEALRAIGPDLLITDFEAFSWRAAERLGVPTISLNHQQVVTETIYEIPFEHWLDAQVAKAIISVIAPKKPVRLLLTSFFFPRLRRPRVTALVPPIIRDEVVKLKASRGDHVLVYYNQPEGSKALLNLLREDGRRYIVYNFPPPSDVSRYANVEFKPPSIQGFLKDLASGRGVLCTAGFTLISEALYLGKPLLAVPNRGIFEQTINAIFLAKGGLGKAVVGRALEADDLDDFHQNLDHYAGRLHSRRRSGNKRAVALIEEVLVSTGPSFHAFAGVHHAAMTTSTKQAASSD